MTHTTSFQELLRRCENEDNASSAQTKTGRAPGTDVRAGRLAAVAEGPRQCSEDSPGARRGWMTGRPHGEEIPPPQPPHRRETETHPGPTPNQTQKPRVENGHERAHGEGARKASPAAWTREPSRDSGVHRHSHEGCAPSSRTAVLTAHGTQRPETRTDTLHRELCERPVCTRKRHRGAASAPHAKIPLRPSLRGAPVIRPLCGPPGWRRQPLTAATAAPGEPQPAALASGCLRPDPEHRRTHPERRTGPSQSAPA